MNTATAIILALVAAALVVALLAIRRKRRSGQSPYCSGCALKDVCKKG